MIELAQKRGVVLLKPQQYASVPLDEGVHELRLSVLSGNIRVKPMRKTRTTINESSGSMGIFSHAIRLPHQRREWRVSVFFTMEASAFIVTHGEFTPDGGTWLSPPSGRKHHYDLQTGETCALLLEIRKQFGKLDRVSIVNGSILRNAEVEFCVDS